MNPPNPLLEEKDKVSSTDAEKNDVIKTELDKILSGPNSSAIETVVVPMDSSSIVETGECSQVAKIPEGGRISGAPSFKTFFNKKRTGKLNG